MPFHKIHNAFFWGAITIGLIVLSVFVEDPFYKELIDISLVVSITPLIMKTYNMEPWRGDCLRDDSLKRS